MSPFVSPSFSQLVGRSVVNLSWGKPLPCPTTCPQCCRPLTFMACLKSGNGEDVGASSSPVYGHLAFPIAPSPVPGRRAGAHVSPATCKSADIIRAVVEGITGASACKAQVPCLGRRLGAAAWMGVHLVITPAIPPGMGWPPGQGEGLCSALCWCGCSKLGFAGICCPKLGLALASGLSSITQGSGSVLPPCLHAQGPACPREPCTPPPPSWAPPK